jgi:5-methylcytosine-specific restriction protein A
MTAPESWRSGKTTGERGYGRRWQKVRIGYLQSHPLCKMCESEGRIVPAEVLDHIIPHKGDMELFWDSDNWQGLCKRHHDSDKKLLESGRTRTQFDDKGHVIW